MKREMRRAWRRDIKERKHRRMTIVVPTETDMASYGNNDKTWEQVTEDETLQELLAEFMDISPRTHTEEFFKAGHKIQRWLEDNLAGCAAETQPAVFYMRNADPGNPAEYCGNLVSPGCEEYCRDHVGRDQ